MKNDFKEIGGWVFKVPENVLKLGLLLDAYKKPQLKEIWRNAEREAVHKLPLFNADDFFYEEIVEKGEMIYSFRYYTPIGNRHRKELSDVSQN